ncbi:MAG TPA: pantoate--beta-alanine ligase [Candidatus Wirthbacteria bacterium]|nr:pantoate--beta-alanine ligase [Candidatus Wirthbacteria bacterium]
MLVIQEPANIKEMISHWKEDGQTVGLVPTMGFLHAGHLSLVKESIIQCDRTVVSIFVNPTQFSPNEDLASYPRDLDKDVALLDKEGVDLIFAPHEENMYAADFCTIVEVGGLSQKLAGQHRPTHFQGVTTVCAKLFNIVQPDKSFFGQKDYQQTIILQQMVKDLNIPTRIIMMPIIREPDGLAMSSRNTYLSPDQRKQSLILSQMVKLAQEIYQGGEEYSEYICQKIKQQIQQYSPLLEIKYITIVDPLTLEPVNKISKGDVLLMEVYVGRTRLYDNHIF